MADKMYQIRRKSDGLYSTGGTWPSFNTVGKIWTRPGSLKNHVVMVNQQFKRYQEHYPYGDCEIVTLVIHRDELASLLRDPPHHLRSHGRLVRRLPAPRKLRLTG